MKVHVETDGTISGTRIFDMETGLILSDLQVKKISISINSEESPPPVVNESLFGSIFVSPLTDVNIFDGLFTVPAETSL